MFPKTPTEIAQYAATMAVQMKVTQITQRAIASNSNADPNTLTVKVAAITIGAVAAGLMKPYTDTAVELASSRIAAWQLNRSKNTR